MSRKRLPDAYFEEMYARSADPWDFSNRWYERRKRALTMAALPKPCYRNAFEPGCSTGMLTAELAARCDRVVATDIIEAPLRTAAERLAALPEIDPAAVEFRIWALGDDWPAEQFDLIVLSEVGYYLDRDALSPAIDAAVNHLETGGTLLCVHWRHPVADYPLGGGEVHGIIASRSGLTSIASYRDEDFLLDVYETSHTGPFSVARREGLV
ncbi:class I SAM-dependent DNA methyltransferase [Nocardia sp. NPDC055321]